MTPGADLAEGQRLFLAAVEADLTDRGFTPEELAATGYPFPVTLRLSTEITCSAIEQASRCPCDRSSPCRYPLCH